MRLIDADVLLTDRRKRMYYHLPNGDIAIPLIDIEHAPTVDPQPKTGKWIDKSCGIEGAWNYCSVCGEQAIDLYDYCPNCGAMMKEGD